MILLPGAGLVVLEMPKAASQSLRAMLDGLADPGFLSRPRHAGAAAFEAGHRRAAEARAGRRVETLCVVREPVARLRSWWAYRAGRGALPPGLGFADFAAACIAPAPPGWAMVGRQDRFTGWDGQSAPVDHMFDQAALPRLVAFLMRRTGRPLMLPRRNVSAMPCDPPLSGDLGAALARALAGEVALHAAVARAGHLRRDPGPMPGWPLPSWADHVA
ncbi:MAG TPA: hypothetical protein PKD10_15955 [Paracoccaceae bacterium]|nr:hypothetical protein [Paracoccaceae bacterium]HMO72024.1 hypothetical protein [Paracoccaceae bacterium]